MFATVAVGRLIRFASRITKHGGSALPGKVVEKIDPGFLSRALDQLPLGVVLVSGTNGKTTTTRMVASMLSDLGLQVFTNPTGSNFVRGVVSALLTEVNLAGKLDADIAVLELDEAYAVHFVKQVKPRYALLLNVMRDQLDRFGEIDTTAHLLSHVAEATTGIVVLNREDQRIAALAAKVPAGTAVRYFGLTDDLKHFFPSDDDMATTVSAETTTPPVRLCRTAPASGGGKMASRWREVARQRRRVVSMTFPPTWPSPRLVTTMPPSTWTAKTTPPMSNSKASTTSTTPQPHWLWPVR